MPRAAALRRLIVRLFVAAAALYALARWQQRQLPPPDALLPELAQPPVQGPTERAPFEFEYAGKRTFVRPVASYALEGLVVSRNDIHAFADIYHDETSVDTADLCVVWGRNAESGAYREVEFWSGPFTCYLRTPDGVVIDGSAVANNHLITDRPELRRAVARVHRGDQVRLRGLLVDYRTEEWGDVWRRTSTVRNDSGCEIVFLDELEVVVASAPLWHASARLAGTILVLLPLAWLATVVVEARRGRSSLGEL